MRILLLLPVLILVHHLSFGQTIYTTTQLRFNLIKQIVQPDIIQLPDSVIAFPITGLTNISNIPSSMISGAYTEIELWIIDSKGAIIYNNMITTTPYNPYLKPFDAEYCRYMKLQSNYLLQQRHIVMNNR